MAKIFKNENELKRYLYKVESKVIDTVSKYLLEDFQKHLQKTVYQTPAGEYQRYGGANGLGNGGFGSGWEIDTGVKWAINDYVRVLFFNSSKLIAPQNDMINSQMSHGGKQGEDIRGMMAEVLNNAAENSYFSYNGGAFYSVGYWDSYLKNVEKKIDSWFDKEFKKYGIRRG